MTVSCRINGRLYPSQRAAAAALGVTESAICHAIIRGQEDNVCRFKRLQGNQHARHIPVVIFGRSYRSKLSAARNLGIPYRTFCRWLDNGSLGSLMIAISKVEAPKAEKAA